MNVFAQKAFGLAAGWAAEGPWRSRSVLAALLAVVVGLGSWFSDLGKSPPSTVADRGSAAVEIGAPSNPVAAPTAARLNWRKPLPAYARLGASYAAGFCLGWFFRKLTRLILVAGALVIVLLAYGKYAGLDTTHAQAEVKRGDAWAQHEAATAESHLRHLLPSAAGGGLGTFLGFRRRNKSATPPATV